MFSAGSSISAIGMAALSQTEVDQAVQSILKVAGPLIRPEDAEKLYTHFGNRDVCLKMNYSDTARYHLTSLAVSASAEAEQPQPCLPPGATDRGHLLCCTAPSLSGRPLTAQTKSPSTTPSAGSCSAGLVIPPSPDPRSLSCYRKSAQRKFVPGRAERCRY